MDGGGRPALYACHDNVSLKNRLKDFFSLPTNRRFPKSEVARKRSAPSLSGCKNETLWVADACSEAIRTSKQDFSRQSFESSPDTPTSPTRLVVSKDCRSTERVSCARTVFATNSCLDEYPCDTVSLGALCNARHCIQGNLASSVALGIPEIVENILQKLDEILWQSNSSLLTRGSRKSSELQNDEDEATCTGPLYACLTVDRIFNWAAKRIISRRIELNKLEQLERYSSSVASRDNLCRDLLVHRIKTCDQSMFDSIQQYRLKSLELYVCPKLVPNQKMLGAGTLIKLALPGCGLVTDKNMAEVAMNCPLLEILDLRACELVTDDGIIQIADSCPRLSYLNVGRVKNSGAITDRSIARITKKTSVETLGLAGCGIGDRTVLSIAHNRGLEIERLSMNQCHLISDYSINILLQNSPKLQVLEVVGCEDVKDAKALCNFKIKSGALVETSEALALQIREYERVLKEVGADGSLRSRRANSRRATISALHK